MKTIASGFIVFQQSIIFKMTYAMLFRYTLISLFLLSCGSDEMTEWNSIVPRTEVFISDANDFNGPWQILRIFNDGEHVEVFTENVGRPQEIVIIEDMNTALISNYGKNNITKHNLETGDYLGVFASGLGQPTRMKIGADNLLYVLQWSGDALVKRFQLDGTFVDTFTDFPIPQSIGMDWDAHGNLYISTYSDGDGGGFVRKFDSSGKDMGFFINTRLQGPTDIWFDGDELLLNDYPNGTVKRFDSNGEFIGVFISGLSLNEGVAYLENGNILIGNGGTRSIKMYDSKGAFISDYLTSGTLNLQLPNAITVREVSN